MDGGQAKGPCARCDSEVGERVGVHLLLDPAEMLATGVWARDLPLNPLTCVSAQVLAD